jgi:hypothetical protein
MPGALIRMTVDHERDVLVVDGEEMGEEEATNYVLLRVRLSGLRTVADCNEELEVLRAIWEVKQRQHDDQAAVERYAAQVVARRSELAAAGLR